MIKAILFDAGGVLHVSNNAVSEDVQKEFGFTDEQRDEFFAYYIPLIGTGKITEEELWMDASNRFGIRDVKVSERLLTRDFEDQLEKMPGMYELVDELKNKGLIVALLTNVSPQFAEVLTKHGHYDPFEIKVLSFEAGSWKPDLGIYKQALKLVDCLPEETIFIDDQMHNILAGESLGIHGIVFQNAEQVKNQIIKIISEQADK